MCVVALSNDRACSGSADCTVREWDLTTGGCVNTLAGHTDTVRCIAALPEDRRIVSGSYRRRAENKTQRRRGVTSSTPRSGRVGAAGRRPEQRRWFGTGTTIRSERGTWPLVAAYSS